MIERTVRFAGLMLLLWSPLLNADCVVLLHGLARTDASMSKMQAALSDEGFRVENISYPSRHHTIQELAPFSVNEGLQACGEEHTVHFVTHSLGGILVRYQFRHHLPENLGRVVMLAPPNQGSEVVDVFGRLPGFRLIHGPAGNQLGTGAESLPGQLGPVAFEAGVIAGTRSINPVLSQALPNPDDGKVSVQSTRVEGMKDFIEVRHSHPMIMRADEVIRQTILFLQTGQFDHAHQVN
jgi:hypothetical protein